MTERIDIELYFHERGRTRRTFKGIVKESTVAEERMRQEMRKTLRENERLLRQRVTDLKRSEREALRAVQTAEQQKRREFTKTSREMRMGFRAALKQNAQDLRRFVSENRGAIAGALGASAAVGIRGAVSRAGRLARLPTREEAFATGERVQRQLLALQTEAGLSDKQRDALAEQLLSVGEKYGQSAETLLQAALTAQQRFSDVTLFTDNAETFARFAAALNTEVSSAQDAMGEFVRQMNISSEEIPRALAITQQAVAEGSIEVTDLTETFSAQIGQFARTFQTEGEEGLRQFLATAEALGGGGENADRTRTLLQAMLTAFNDPKVRKELAERGARITDRSGRLLSPDQILDRIARSSGLDTETERAGVFTNVRARQAIGILLQQIGRDPEAIRNLINVDAEAGQRTIDSSVDRFLGSSVGQLQQRRSRVENNVIRNFDSLADKANAIIGPIEELRSQFPALSAAIETAIEVILTAGVTGAFLGRGRLPKGIFGRAAGGVGGGIAGGITGGARAAGAAAAGRAAGLGAGFYSAGGAAASSTLAGIVPTIAAAAGAVLAAATGGLALGAWLERTFDLQNRINDLFGVDVGGEERRNFFSRITNPSQFREGELLGLPGELGGTGERATRVQGARVALAREQGRLQAERGALGENGVLQPEFGFIARTLNSPLANDVAEGQVKGYTDRRQQQIDALTKNTEAVGLMTRIFRLFISDTRGPTSPDAGPTQ